MTVTQKDADTWTIAGFNWKVGLNGTYVLTVNGAGITDLAGNAGSGSASETWVMDIVAPQAATNLAIIPDNGESASDALSNSLSFTLGGNLHRKTAHSTNSHHHHRVFFAESAADHRLIGSRHRISQHCEIGQLQTTGC